MLKKLQDLFKSRKQKGQSLIFFAASAPILCAFIGAAMDFGWMYYNQSRLQNAADAAATAGAASLLEDEMPLSDYSYTTLIATNNEGLQRMASQAITSPRVRNKGNAEKPIAGDSVAQYYAKYNLESWNNSKNKTQIQLVDNDNVGVIENNGIKTQNVKFETELYGKDTEDYGALYYTVTLTTKIEHLFGSIMDAFGIDTLPAKAVSAVKISHIYENRIDNNPSDYPHGESLYVQMKRKEVSETYPNWEEIKFQKGNSGTAADSRSVLTAGSYYKNGNIYRTEIAHLNGYGFNVNNRIAHDNNVKQYEWDDLFIDFEPDINGGASNGDVDLKAGTSTGWQLGDSSSNKKYYRIHYPIMIESVYKVRSGKEPPDSLYIFIEQEAIIQSITYSNGSTGGRGNMNTVHQISINNNVANTNEDTDRPLVFFYEGPEIPSQSSKPKLYDSDGDYIGTRPFLPVILNLYADFRGILFIPNNPVVINGNGHKFTGFVVAREFRRLKTTNDFSSAVYSSDNKATYHTDISTDVGKPVYVAPYQKTLTNGAKFNVYAEVKNWKELASGTSGYTSVKVKVGENWVNGYVKNSQFYTRNGNPDMNQYVQIDMSDKKEKYAFFQDVLLKTKYNGKDYVATYTGKYYLPVNSMLSGYPEYGYAYTQNFYDSTHNNVMYLSGIAYTYTEKYMNTSGKIKEKTSYMSIGDVQYMNINTVNATVDSDGNYTEKPGDVDSFTDDDKERYDYINIFNLNSNSTYNSFYNVGLVNYTYLAKTEGGAKASHDMFFTTVRSKHVD